MHRAIRLALVTLATERAVEKPGVTVIWNEEKAIAFVSGDGSVEFPGSDEAGSIEDLEDLLAA